MQQLCARLQSPPASAKVPKSVSDRKRFFENAMEDHNKPAPKSGKSIKCICNLEFNKSKKVRNHIKFRLFYSFAGDKIYI